MSEAERDLKAKVFALVSDYIPTNEPRNAQLARLLGSEMVHARRQAFIEVASLMRVRLAIYSTKEADSDPFQEPHLNTWDKYQHTREAFEIAVEEINEAAGIIEKAEETQG